METKLFCIVARSPIQVWKAEMMVSLRMLLCFFYISCFSTSNCQTITGFSPSFEYNTYINHEYPIINHSAQFVINTKISQGTPLANHSGSTTLNTLLHQGSPSIASSDLFGFNAIGAQLLADFTIDTMASKSDKNFWDGSNFIFEINEPIQFQDQSSGVFDVNAWQWNFGDGSAGGNRFEQNPIHSFNSPGQYTIQLTASNELGVHNNRIKTNYLTVYSPDNGIELQIIKTDPNKGPNIAKVGYYYSRSRIIKRNIRVNDFYIDDQGFVTIDSFPVQNDMPWGWTLTSSFNNEIILYDSNDNPVGHITYFYDPKTEKRFKRNAILILHNDNDIIAGGAFPYGYNQEHVYKGWEYYNTGEYPVSMLIPPYNTFFDQYIKEPLLLIHGWEGKFSLKNNPDAISVLNETSYWFTTVKDLSPPIMQTAVFDAWQYYYPYNTAISHLGICLKYAIDHLRSYYTSPNNRRIGLVTHSMGGLVTMNYLTKNPDHASANIKRVLFSAPPFHGSWGANRFYRHNYQPPIDDVANPVDDWLIGYDSNAPAVRDMMLGSDFTWDLYQGSLPVLNNSVSEDYFVLLGTTYKWYLSDAKFQGYFNLLGFSPFTLHTSLHSEAAKHHDGIVSISSGSLLNKNIGFATFHGNHNDAVHMQSFLRGNKNRQNIGERSLLPEIITEFFTKDYSGFSNFLISNQHITAIVDGYGTVVKPVLDCQSLNCLDIGNEEVDFKKGMLIVEFQNDPGTNNFYAFYNGTCKHLVLRKFAIPTPGYNYLGRFKRNTVATNPRYYFSAYSLKGSAISLNADGDNFISVDYGFSGSLPPNMFNYNYCQTNFLTIDNTKTLTRNFEHNYTDIKDHLLLSVDELLPDSLMASIYIDDQADWVEFNLSSISSVINDYTLAFNMKLPDGSLADSTFAGASYFYDGSIGNISMQIPEPMPGQWHVWLTSKEPVTDSLIYSAMAFIDSGVYAYLPDSINSLTANSPHTILAGIQVEDPELIDNLNVYATIYKPNTDIEVENISSSMELDGNTFFFSLEYSFDSPGEYVIKYNLDGLYNDYHFERCLHHQVEIIDTVPRFNVPNIVLRQKNPAEKLNLSQYLSNTPDIDTLFFSKEIIYSTIDSLAYMCLMDSLARMSYLSTNLTDTGTVNIRYFAHFDNEIVYDDVFLKIVLPDLFVNEIELSDTVLSSNSGLILNYSIYNTGNYHADTYEIKYFLSKDSILSVTDHCLGAKTISHHTSDSIIVITDTLNIFDLYLTGNNYFLLKVDYFDQIAETNKLNNLTAVNVVVNEPPSQPTLISAVPGNKSVHLKWTSNHQNNISGYVIHYGLDTLEVMQKIYPLNNDTTHTVAGLLKDNEYFFAVTSYMFLGVDSEFSEFLSATPFYIPSIPSGLMAEDISYDSVLINWTPGDNESMWDILFGSEAFEPETEGILLQNITEKPYLITGLDPGTSYDIYVRAVCGDNTSEWAGPLSITTLDEDLAYELPLTFNQGFTWFSLNVEPETGMDVNDLFTDLSPCVNDRVISQTAFAFYSGTEWMGSLTHIDPARRYVMHLCSAQGITLEGTAAETTPIAISPGFYWLGYTPQDCLPVNTALASISDQAETNDRIISQTSFSFYNGTSWIGSLTQMCPGVGYMLHVASPVTLTYPEATPGKHDAWVEAEKVSPTGAYPQKNLQYTMPVLGKLIGYDKQVSVNEGDVIYAYVGDELRGMAYPMAAHDGFVFMSIGSNIPSGEEVHFKAWIAELKQLKQINETARYEAFKGLGSMESPFIFTLGKALSSEEMPADGLFIGDPYPNPLTRQTHFPYVTDSPSELTLRVYDSLGRMVYEDVHTAESPGRHSIAFERDGLPVGVYHYHLVMQAGSRLLDKSGRVVIMK
jgi:PKD repeat protein